MEEEVNLQIAPGSLYIRKEFFAQVEFREFSKKLLTTRCNLTSSARIVISTFLILLMEKVQIQTH